MRPKPPLQQKGNILRFLVFTFEVYEVMLSSKSWKTLNEVREILKLPPKAYRSDPIEKSIRRALILLHLAGKVERQIDPTETLRNPTHYWRLNRYAQHPKR